MRLTLHQGSGSFATYAEMSAWFRTTDYIVVLHRLKHAHPNNGAVRLILLPLVFAHFEPLSPFDLSLDEKEQALDHRSWDFWLISPVVRVRGGCCTEWTKRQVLPLNGSQRSWFGITGTKTCISRTLTEAVNVGPVDPARLPLVTSIPLFRIGSLYPPAKHTQMCWNLRKM